MQSQVWTLLQNFLISFNVALIPDATMNKQRINKRELLRKIKSEFPELTFLRSRFINYGDDHVVVILDGKIVFRFPRTTLYRKSFVEEIKLLQALKNRTTLPLPEYIYLPKNKEFGGYKLIKGDELTERRFALLSKEHKNKLASNIADFLNALHKLDKKILPKHRAAEPWSMSDLDQYKKRYWEQRRKFIASFVDNVLLKHIDTFYDLLIDACSNCPYTTIIHGDFSGDHMLINKRKKLLSGIIDFGDAAIGDPAHDFSWLWTCSKDIVKTVHKKYKGSSDKNLLSRSEWFYARYTIDRLYCLIRDKKLRKAAWVRNILQKQLHLLLNSEKNQS